MDQILPPELSDVELEALRQIAAHPATSHIPAHVQSRLEDVGYAKEVLGGLVLTDDGLQRIAIDRDFIRTFVANRYLALTPRALPARLCSEGCPRQKSG